MVFAVPALLTFLGTALVLRYARRALLDVPNDRSSHSTPTPRGGGLAFVLAIVLWLLWIGAAGRGSWTLIAAALCGVPVAAVGWIDDRKGVSAALRLLIHVFSAVAAVVILRSSPEFRAAGFVPDNLLGTPFMVLAIVWSINLFNFMDGIDAIATVQALCVASGMALMSLAAGSSEVAAIYTAIAAAMIGFLIWNKPPARIFMGDVGSGFLGFLLIIPALAADSSGAVPLPIWGVLHAVFLVDATVTLVRRLAVGERVHKAHRSHAYQRAVSSGFTHAAVSSAVFVANLALLGIAWFGFGSGSWFYVVIALALTVALYLWVESRQPMRAGFRRPEVNS